MQQNISKEKYERLVKLAGKAAITAATILIILKLIAWFMTRSSSILAALTDSIMDVTTSIINLFAIKIALQPADDDHRFGHGKAESLASLAQAAFIAGSSIFLLFSSISAIIHGNQIASTSFAIGVMFFSLLLTILLVLFQSYVVKTTGSMAIKADSLHYRADIILNAAVLLAIFLAGMGWHWADGFFAILVSFYILYSAWEITFLSINSLMDKQLPKSDEEKIIKIAYQINGVHGIHDLRTRESGNTKFIQFHLELDDDLSLLDAHEKADKVEAKLALEFLNADIIIHIDPLSIVPVEKRNKKLHFLCKATNETSPL
ncbi:MAG: cation diffusion facilitator family transporter [Psychromonas sp.]|nr:cation diffusion facilitator family transporter [Psychromonas sp.]